MLNRRSGIRSAAAVACLGMIVAACSSDGPASEATTSDRSPSTTAAIDSGHDPAQLPPAALEIMAGDDFASARWSVLVEPVAGGDPVYAIDHDVVTPMASVTKMYSVGTWLDVHGPEHRIETPVHAIGAVADAGITRIDGRVLIDDRLFEPWTTDRPLEISSIAINDNLLAVVTTPTTDGQPAVIETIPETAAFEIVNETRTVADGDETALRVTNRPDARGAPTNTLVVNGQIAADSDERLNVYSVDDPASYARTLFIEALERAGVAVAADPLAGNDASDLAPADDYTSEPPLGTIESPTAAALATFVLKTSNNFGADLTVCLLAVHQGSTDCHDGFDPIRERLHDLDIAPGEVWLFDGSGSGSASTTPTAMLTWLQWLHAKQWGGQLPEMLPILGVDGSLALSETDGPSTGRVQAKTGTWAQFDPSTARLLVPTQALAGFMDADDGTVYSFTLFMNGASFESLDGILTSSDTVARVAAAIQQQL